MKNKEEMIEIWGDVVNVKSLVYSILFISFTTMASFFIAPKNNKTAGLFLGLLGAVIGFVIITIIVKPKRIIKEEKVGEK